MFCLIGYKYKDKQEKEIKMETVSCYYCYGDFIEGGEHDPKCRSCGTFVCVECHEQGCE
jgi:hypothetical protein